MCAPRFPPPPPHPTPTPPRLPPRPHPTAPQPTPPSHSPHPPDPNPQPTPHPNPSQLPLQSPPHPPPTPFVACSIGVFILCTLNLFPAELLPERVHPRARGIRAHQQGPLACLQEGEASSPREFLSLSSFLLVGVRGLCLCLCSTRASVFVLLCACLVISELRQCLCVGCLFLYRHCIRALCTYCKTYSVIICVLAYAYLVALFERLPPPHRDQTQAFL